jgi:ParB family chromosome partitioning protein
MIHELKLSTEFFLDVIKGKKTFEMRKNDRPFKVGDLLALNEYDTENKTYTGNSCLVYIDYILDNKAYCIEGTIVMAIKPCSVWRHDRPFNECKMEKDYGVPYATKKSEVDTE